MLSREPTLNIYTRLIPRPSFNPIRIMKIEEFISKFESAIDDLEPGVLSAESRFRELSQWDSLAALSILVLVNSELNVTISGNELKSCTTVMDIYQVVISKMN